ncbi:MAG: hydrolase [Bdellovibrio sp. CG10_big_fil_rev_8_21_14_0_10_47_8]|nr:MAG: hydrolase [Bdellovibrio sp. CG10_big_fil_rev_8_21_14_0_10_47_8]
MLSRFNVSKHQRPKNFLILLISICCVGTSAPLRSDSSFDELIVWNVGQGQWVTEVKATVCIHYDAGGERNPRQEILRKCSGKQNYLLLSHWDWDHIGWAPDLAAQLPKLCLFSLPQGPANARKQQALQAIPLCTVAERNQLLAFVQVIYRPQGSFGFLSSPNDWSQVVVSKDFQALIPGDSPVRQEKKWLKLSPTDTRGLILGHHGSRTSTGKRLLEYLPGLRWAVASARKQRYGHPHPQIVALLKKEKVPLLRTQDWGHLRFQKRISR